MKCMSVPIRYFGQEVQEPLDCLWDPLSHSSLSSTLTFWSPGLQSKRALLGDELVQACNLARKRPPSLFGAPLCVLRFSLSVQIYSGTVKLHCSAGDDMTLLPTLKIFAYPTFPLRCHIAALLSPYCAHRRSKQCVTATSHFFFNVR